MRSHFSLAPTELAGLKIFLKAATGRDGWLPARRQLRVLPSGAGFYRFLFHNTGVAQAEYDYRTAPERFYDAQHSFAGGPEPEPDYTCPHRRIIPMPASPSGVPPTPTTLAMRTLGFGMSI